MPRGRSQPFGLFSMCILVQRPPSLDPDGGLGYMTCWLLPLESPRQWLEPTSLFLLTLSDHSRSTYAPNPSVRWWIAWWYRANSKDRNRAHFPYSWHGLLHSCYISLHPTGPTCSEALVLPPLDMSVDFDAIFILSKQVAVTLLYLPFPHFVPLPLSGQLAQTCLCRPVRHYLRYGSVPESHLCFCNILARKFHRWPKFSSPLFL